MSSPTKEKIKRVAFSLFAAKGYDATTMEQIAAGVGIKKPTLYAYFTGKEELFLMVYEELEKDYHKLMQQAFAATQDMPAPERLYQLFKQYIMYFAQNLEIAALWNRVFYFPPAALKEKLVTTMADNEASRGKMLAEIFQEGMRQGRIRKAPAQDMLFSYYSIREGILALMLVYVPPTEARINQVWQDFWLGIKENG